MSTFDPQYTLSSMAPELSANERLDYLRKEIDKVLEMLDGAEDCKWIYQSLIDLNLLYKRINGDHPPQSSQLKAWIGTLKKLDPLRSGRWDDQASKIQ